MHGEAGPIPVYRSTANEETPSYQIQTYMSSLFVHQRMELDLHLTNHKNSKGTKKEVIFMKYSLKRNRSREFFKKKKFKVQMGDTLWTMAHQIHVGDYKSCKKWGFFQTEPGCCITEQNLSSFHLEITGRNPSGSMTRHGS